MIQESDTKKTVPVNDTTSYNNGIKNVPTQLLEPVDVDKANVTDVLVKAKYYTADQLK
jgi:putative multiple sugar transport system substrate-binding protein